MSSTKLLVVMGATGNQGGSVVNAFIDEPGYTIRAVTRNPSSSKAKALAERGVEVVQADLDQPDTLTAAFEGANAIFAVSDFWGLYADPANKDRAKPGQPLNVWAGEHETQQLKNVIDAAARVSMLERFILSSLSNASKWSKGKYTHVYHFDSKANAEDYGRETYPDLWSKTSIYQAGMFLSNFVVNAMLRPAKRSDGTVQFSGHIDGDTKIPFIAAEEDSGPFVKALLNESPGKNLIGYREWVNHREVAEAFTKATGIQAEHVTLPRGQFPDSMDPSLKLELEDNMAYFDEFGYEARDDPTVIHPRELKSVPALGSVEDYFKKQDWTKIFGA